MVKPGLLHYYKQREVHLMTISVSVFWIYFFPQVISNNLRLDKGTETGYMATIHSYLRQQGDASSNGTDAVHYDPSTNNKVFLCGLVLSSS